MDQLLLDWQKFSQAYAPWPDVGVILSTAVLVIIAINMVLKIMAARWQAKYRPALNFTLQALRLPISVSVMLTALYQIVTMTMPSWGMLDRLHQVFFTIDILVWGQFAYRSSRFYLKNLSDNPRMGSFIQPKTLPLLENVSAVLVFLVIFYLIFVNWNIDMTAWLASAGIIGIAVGFAAKDTIANLLSGVFILADSPYKIGDYVVLDSGDRGKVTNIGLRSTRILTRDDLEVNIPNAIIANGKIINESGGKDIRSRVRVPVGVAYGSDIDLVQKVLLEVANAEPEVCKEPEARTRFRSFGASSLDFELLVWIEESEFRGRLVHKLNCEIYKAFHANDIEIPFSQHDLHIKSWSPEAGVPELTTSMKAPMDLERG